MRVRHLLIVLIAAATAGGLLQAAAATIPQRSAERARLFDEWRTVLRSADSARADERHSEAAELYAAVIAAAEANHPRHLLVARAIDGLADVHRLQHRWSEAAEGYSRSAALWNDLLGPDQPRRAVSLHHLGMVQTELERLEPAQRSFAEAHGIFGRTLGPDSAEAQNTLRALERVQAWLSLDEAP